MAEDPLVSCIMPTCNRRRFVGWAVADFLAQDYPRRELILVDDGDDPIDDLIPDDGRFRHLRLDARRTVGHKRNLACEAARGELIAHWDDDDWYAPQRLSQQVEALRDPAVELCGIPTLLYFDLDREVAWEYRAPASSRGWLSMLCYRKTLWRRIRFPEIRVASDTRFLWQVPTDKMRAIDDAGLNVCTIHSGNLSPKQVDGPEWRSIPVAAVREVMGPAFSRFRSRAAAPPAAEWTVLVPTFDRPEPLSGLLDDLEREADAGTRLEVRVYDDASSKEYGPIRERLDARGWSYQRAARRHGLREHWRWVARIFSDLARWPPAAGIAYLHDDYRLCRRFFSRVEKEWQAIDDPRKLALTVAVDAARRRRPCWTGVPPTRAGSVWRTQWLDGAFVASPELFAALDHTVPAVPSERWRAEPGASSGVGRALSVRLNAAGYGLYRVDRSLARHRDLPSVLHPGGGPRPGERTVGFVDRRRKRPPSARARRRWVVVVMAFERPGQLAALLRDLEGEQAQGRELDVRVYDDASRVDLEEAAGIVARNGWRLRRSTRNHGKAGYWHWVTAAYGDLRGLGRDDLVVFLQDDVRLCDRFFDRVEREWSSIEDPSKATLTLLVDSQRASRACWTGVAPRREGRVWRTQWVDQLFVAGRRFLEAIDYRVPPVPPDRWRFDRGLSSGVGQSLSLSLHLTGRSMFRVDRSLLVHAQGASKMNPEVRHSEIMTTLRFIDGDTACRRRAFLCPVIASLASIPQRQANLERVVTDLMPQVDRLRVYLNGYPETPDFLDKTGVEIATSREHGDRGDAGKFFWPGDRDAYRLSCDDDLVYPPDYVSRMVASVERYRRQAVVGVHGVLLRPPVLSYYRNRTLLHFSQEVELDTPVHITGTGCTAFHGSTLPLSRNDFPIPNMADIWLGRVCQEQAVPMLAVARPAGWLLAQPVESSIFERYLDFDAVQTRVVNEIEEWLLHEPEEPSFAPRPSSGRPSVRSRPTPPG